MHYAWYSLQDVSILVNNINFSSELPPTRRSSMSFGNRTRQGILQGTDFLVWPRTENTTARISHSNVVDLRKPKSLQVEISSGWNEIEYGRLIVKPGSAGLRLENSEAKAVGKARPGPSLHGPSHEYEDSSFKVNMRREQPSTIRFEKLERNQTQAVRIPYSLEHDLNEVTLKIELTYQTESGEFIFLSNTSCSVALALSVNVQEIFKPKALFSRFTVGPINSTPLRLHSCLVEGNNYFDALTPTVQNTPTDVFARQPYSLISKIQRKHPTKAVSAGLSKSFQRLLHLQIRYNCLDQEILDAIDQSLTSLLKTNTTKQYHFLMRDRLNETFRLGKGPWADMETSCLVGDFPKGSFEDYEWTKILPGLLPNEASELEAILRAWYEVSGHVPGQLRQISYDVGSTHDSIFQAACGEFATTISDCAFRSSINASALYCRVAVPQRPTGDHDGRGDSRRRPATSHAPDHHSSQAMGRRAYSTRSSRSPRILLRIVRQP